MQQIPTSQVELDLISQKFVDAANARGIETSVKIDATDQRQWLAFSVGETEYLWSIGVAGTAVCGCALLENHPHHWGAMGQNINREALILTCDKILAKQHLLEKGFSVPKGFMFRRRNIAEAYAAFDAFDGPICVKPNNGSLGNHVHPGITDREWYKKAIDNVAASYPKILVEESVEGSHFRFFYVHPKVVGIRHGLPMHVIGDGVSSVRQLTDARNEERRKRAIPSQMPFPVTDFMLDYLARNGWSMDDIPAASEKVYLSGASNGTAGADTILCWDEIHPSYRELVEKACASFPGLFITGADIIIKDITQPARPDNYWLLEVNMNPAMAGFYYPREGEPVDLATKVMDMLHDRSAGPQEAK